MKLPIRQEIIAQDLTAKVAICRAASRVAKEHSLAVDPKIIEAAARRLLEQGGEPIDHLDRAMELDGLEVTENQEDYLPQEFEDEISLVGAAPAVLARAGGARAAAAPQLEPQERAPRAEDEGGAARRTTSRS